jgi:hypothetical protein
MATFLAARTFILWGGVIGQGEARTPFLVKLIARRTFLRRAFEASVDFLDPRGAPVQRPYMGGAPSLKMVAHYDDYNGMFEVDLWEGGKGFILDLTHEYNYELDPERREALVPALSRNERDHFLDACHFFAPERD